MIKRSVILFVTIFCCLHILKGQSNSYIYRYLAFNPVEQIALFTDRHLYIAGEEVWFQAYNQIQPINATPCLSKVLYVDLVNTEKQIVAGAKYRLNEYNASGSFQIPEEIPSGTYLLRAYTRLMRNYPAEAYTIIPVTIVNPLSPPESLALHGKANSENTNGILADTSLDIRLLKDNEGLLITIKQKSSSATPVKRYKSLIIRSPDLSTFHEFEIGTFMNEFTLEVQNDKLKQGLNYFILTGINGEILHIHPHYKTINQTGLLKIETNKDHYGTRQKVNFRITSNELSKATVSVVKKGCFNEIDDDFPLFFADNPQFINAFSLLNSTNNLTALQPPDSVLQQYTRRINQNTSEYNHLTYKKFPLNFWPETRDVSISGVVRDKETLKPIGDVKVMVSILFETVQVHVLKTRPDGSFNFPLYNTTGIKDLYVGIDHKGAQNAEILINNDFSNDFNAFHNTSYLIDSSFRGLLDEMYTAYQVGKNIHHSISSEEEASTAYPPQFLEGVHTVYMDDYIELNSVAEIFKEIVPNVRIRKDGDDFYFSMINNDEYMYLNDPLVLVDNVPVFDMNEIFQIHPSQLLSIGVMNGIYVLGDRVLWGLINLKTKTGRFAGITFPEESIFLEYSTITNRSYRQYPDYESAQITVRSLPDFRNTLFWDPEVNISDKEWYSFFTSDQSGDYVIIVRGVNKRGEVISAKHSFSVN